MWVLVSPLKVVLGLSCPQDQEAGLLTGFSHGYLLHKVRNPS